jgi:hypothetical protein
MLTFNGKKFNAGDFTQSITNEVVQLTKAEMGERFRSICHPKTRELKILDFNPVTIVALVASAPPNE